jgi:hypothetical protein
MAIEVRGPPANGDEELSRPGSRDQRLEPPQDLGESSGRPNNLDSRIEASPPLLEAGGGLVEPEFHESDRRGDWSKAVFK